MPLHDSEAIVLRTYPLGDADRLVGLLTRDHGRLRGVAQGARRPKSRFGAALEPRGHGTNIAAGVTPGKSGERVMGVKVYDRVADAVAETGAESSVIFVPAPSFYAAAEEALRAGIKLVVAITERVPIRDELRLVELAKTLGATVIGPNTPGVIIPSRSVKLGIMPATSFRPGTIALFSRSGTLMYEIANQLSTNGFSCLLRDGWRSLRRAFASI
jgi:succinyl-CoA synthetase alpha subunit